MYVHKSCDKYYLHMNIKYIFRVFKLTNKKKKGVSLDGSFDGESKTVDFKHFKNFKLTIKM